jgi:amino acid adenylation domain-containing protein
MKPEYQADRLVESLSSETQCSVSSDTIVLAFERQAALTPDKVAIQLGEKRLTYGDLDRDATRLARVLRGYLRTPDALVALYFDRSIEMVGAMLAVLKAGAAYLPIDATNPRDRIDFLLADASPSLILTHEARIRSLPATTIPIVSVDGEREMIGDPEAPLPGTRSADLAYVIYTSGSTGKPKGVMVTHHNVVRLLNATAPWFGFNAEDVWTLFHSPAFDFSVWEIWACLLTGGRLVVVTHEVTRSPPDFYELLEKERVTVLNQTPAAFYQIIQVEASGPARNLSLRYVIFGGEALNFVALRPWLELHGDASPRLVNMYGITETTVHVTYRPVSASDIRNENRSLIGVPIPDLQLYLLDDQQKPVSAGEIGEIYVGGAGVARGYLNRPQLSAERFLPDPFCGLEGARMYRSGDLARALDNGDIEYLGRGDRQVKIRGFRIELGEIEAALAEHAGVRQSAVMARRDGAVEQRLVAYYVPDPERPTSEAELRTFLRAKLPEHMIPYAYVVLDALPLTVNGKIDREALPAPAIGTPSRPVEARSTTPHEQMVLDVWRKALNVDDIGLDDNFFDLGGTSILLLTAHTGLQGRLRRTIPMTKLFEFATVRSLARYLQQVEQVEQAGQRAQGEADTLPLSAARDQAQKQRAAFAQRRQRQSGSIT